MHSRVAQFRLRLRRLGGLGNCTNPRTNAQTHKKTEFVQKTALHKLEFVRGAQVPLHKQKTQKHKRTNMIEPNRRRNKRRIFVVCIAALFCCIHLFNNMRTRHRLTRSAVLLPKFAPWRHLLSNGDDSSFLELTGMTRHCFMLLHKEIQKLRPIRNYLKMRV